MKEKIKDILLGGTIFYSIVIIILMLINSLNLVTTIELSDSEENIEKLNQYKQELAMLEQNDCTNIIHKLIKSYEETSYDETVELNDLYWYYIDENSTSHLSYYVDIKKQCKLTEEQLHNENYPAKFLYVSIYLDRLLSQYNFQYELSIKDVFSRQHMESNLKNVEYKIKKQTELDIISSLIEYEKKEIDNNA